MVHGRLDSGAARSLCTVGNAILAGQTFCFYSRDLTPVHYDRAELHLRSRLHDRRPRTVDSSAPTDRRHLHHGSRPGLARRSGDACRAGLPGCSRSSCGKGQIGHDGRPRRGDRCLARGDCRAGSTTAMPGGAAVAAPLLHISPTAVVALAAPSVALTVGAFAVGRSPRPASRPSTWPSTSRVPARGRAVRRRTGPRWNSQGV